MGVFEGVFPGVVAVRRLTERLLVWHALAMASQNRIEDRNNPRGVLLKASVVEVEVEVVVEVVVERDAEVGTEAVTEPGVAPARETTPPPPPRLDTSP